MIRRLFLLATGPACDPFIHLRQQVQSPHRQQHFTYHRQKRHRDQQQIDADFLVGFQAREACFLVFIIGGNHQKSGVCQRPRNLLTVYQRKRVSLHIDASQCRVDDGTGQW